MAIIDTEVVIIGGGISGLKAAQDLNSHNVKFELLEARDRFGGRLKTVDLQTSKQKVDIGASWFHDTLSNPLFDEIVKDGTYDLYYDDCKPTVIVSDDNVSLKNRDKIEQVTDEMIKYIELRYFENLDLKDESLQTTAIEYLYAKRKYLTEKQICYSPQLLRHLELWHGVSWDSMSSKYALVDNVGRNCFIKDGYKTVIDKIVQQLPINCLHKTSVVVKIKKNSQNNKITIYTEDNDEYICNYCIVTVPQSILQLPSSSGEKGAIEWEPKLPKNIVTALEKMNFGSLGKFIFEFDKLFWDENESDRIISLADPDHEIYEMLQKNIKPDLNSFKQTIPDFSNCWKYPVLIVNLYSIYQIPCLLVFTQGKLTQFLEANPTKSWEYMKPIISKIFKEKVGNGEKQNTPDPVNIISSSWTIDPFSRGSYAACYPGDDPMDLAIQLSKGFGSIRFAGEHTILNGAGAVHGAWLSGKREARYVLVEKGLMERSLDDEF
ncbi:hypothetical protein PACTADRAFT_32882 [Pachysolen tannophilus NRRL Y-2460]|uniref:Amine oxidase n=1 Tax=Pachysolen tannophilus NRRL Y-2460 TaxID=669874 RepID=A0A1E4U085_PACTA|nr:hypothetical protein PACTADRAFT_32882 [Pachysolen tannophilus NRRL Y-2460]